MKRAAVALAMAAIGMSGCAIDAATSGFDLTEFAVDGPGSLSAETKAVQVSNHGQFPHTLVVTDHQGQVVANTDLLQPGESVSLELDVDPGTYQFTCRIVTEIEGGAIIDHFQEGMSATVDVN